jgi:hypothetical protein
MNSNPSSKLQSFAKSLALEELVPQRPPSSHLSSPSNSHIRPTSSRCAAAKTVRVLSPVVWFSLLFCLLDSIHHQLCFCLFCSISKPPREFILLLSLNRHSIKQWHRFSSPFSFCWSALAKHSAHGKMARPSARPGFKTSSSTLLSPFVRGEHGSCSLVFFF